MLLWKQPLSCLKALRIKGNALYYVYLPNSYKKKEYNILYIHRVSFPITYI